MLLFGIWMFVLVLGGILLVLVLCGWLVCWLGLFGWLLLLFNVLVVLVEGSMCVIVFDVG